jgi:hypothetical protein
MIRIGLFEGERALVARLAANPSDDEARSAAVSYRFLA